MSESADVSSGLSRPSSSHGVYQDRGHKTDYLFRRAAGPCEYSAVLCLLCSLLLRPVLGLAGTRLAASSGAPATRAPVGLLFCGVVRLLHRIPAASSGACAAWPLCFVVRHLVVLAPCCARPHSAYQRLGLQVCGHWGACGRALATGVVPPSPHAALRPQRRPHGRPALPAAGRCRCPRRSRAAARPTKAHRRRGSRAGRQQPAAN